VKPWYIAELLHVDRSAVQRALTHLVELGYLERGDKNGNGFTFRLALPSNGSDTTAKPAAAA
jgi:DNA-binding IclR family transcriptional regulator